MPFVRRFRRVRAVLGAALAGVLCLAGPAALHAQTTSASVSGSVSDSQSGVLPGATVTLTSRTQGNTYTPTQLPVTAVFAYRPLQLDAKRCIPAPGSAAFSGPTAGSLVVFKLPIAGIENRPLDLEIAPPASGEASKRQRIELDI